MIVGGFDISKTATGAAILDGTKVLHAEAHPSPGDDPGLVFASFKSWFRGMLLAHQVEHAAIEQPLRTPMLDTRTGDLSPKSSMQTYLWLYGLRAIALSVCGDLNVPCLEVNQSTWRKSFVGNGHAKKEQSLLIARQLYPKLKSKDAAEAIGIAWHLNGELNFRASDMFAEKAKVA